jgi:hypothetical protein
MELPEAARAFVEGDVALMGGALSDAEIGQLVDYLVAGGDGARLQKLAESPDKRLAKPARRGLHLLRTRGHAVPAPEKREFRLRGPYTDEQPPGMVSFIDGAGERVVWLVRNGTDGFQVYQAELSETRGLIGFSAGTVPRKDWRQHVDSVLGDRRRMVHAAPHDQIRALLERAYQKTLAAGRTAPEEFARARLDLGPPVEWARPPIEVIDDRRRQARLHELPEIAPWVPPEEVLQKLDLELGQIATSQLVVDPAAREQQRQQVIDKLADALTPEFRQLLAERLEETALLVGGDEAGLCMGAAAAVRDPAVAGSDHPFLRMLFEKLIKKTEEEKP